MSATTRASRGAIAAAALIVGASIIALAASLALPTQSVGAAKVAAPRCTNAALLVVPNLSGANVVSVTVSGLPTGCGNATIQATVNNGPASGSGSSTVPAGGGSVTVSLGTAVASAASALLDVVLTGP